jgi:hypothetical protein
MNLFLRLLQISSSPYDQYFVTDFDKVSAIVKELAKTTCGQPAELAEQDEVVQTVAKNSYKYFKYPISPGQTEITLVLNDISGTTRLFYSFDDTRPKDEADYISYEKDAGFRKVLYKRVF